MNEFATKSLPARPDMTTLDGSAVHILLNLSSGSMAHFEFAAGKTSLAVVHRMLEEVWHVISAHDEMGVTNKRAGGC